MSQDAPDTSQLDPRLVKLYTEALHHQKQGNKSGALLAYRRLQSQFPDFADGWINGSVVMAELGRTEESLAMALRAVELAPDSPSAHCALAGPLMGMGRTPEAVEQFEKAILLDPAHFPALTNLAGIYVRRGEFQKAIQLDDRAIEAQPTSSALWGNRGHARMRAMDLEGAEADLRRALELDPDNHQVRWNLAYLQLLQGRFKEAWPNFRARMKLDEWCDNRQSLGKPHWGGEPLDGKTLLVYTEQGYGDTLQFARFLPRLKKYGARVLLSTYPVLKRVLECLPGIDALAVEGEPLPDYDCVVPIMELPVILNVGIEDLAPLPPPQLPPSGTLPPVPELDRPGFKVGLVWAGSPAHSNDELRSMSPAMLRGLADVPGARRVERIAWYGLQKPAPVEPPDLPGFTDLSRHLGDFMDTARIAKRLDLVVTVDTSVAHLAGVLGLPAIVLLAFMPDWRWGLGETSPWYPSLTLLRQPAHGDWGSVIEMLKREIAGRIEQR